MTQGHWVGELPTLFRDFGRTLTFGSASTLALSDQRPVIVDEVTQRTTIERVLSIASDDLAPGGPLDGLRSEDTVTFDDDRIGEITVRVRDIRVSDTDPDVTDLLVVPV